MPTRIARVPQGGPFFHLPWQFYAVLAGMMKIPALIMTISGFTVIEGEKLKWLMGMLGFAVALKSWAAEKDVVLVWYGPRGEKNPILVHLVAAVFFVLCVAANSLNQFVTHMETLANEVGAKQVSDVYHKNRETVARVKDKLNAQVAARLPGATERLRTEVRRLRDATRAGQAIGTESRDALAAEVKGLSEAGTIIFKLQPLPLDPSPDADRLLAEQFDQIRMARAKLPASVQALIENPSPAEKPQISTRAVSLWWSAVHTRTPDGLLSVAVGLLLEVLPLLTWLMAGKAIPIADRIRRRREWCREVRESLSAWKTYELEYFIDPIGFSGAWRVEATHASFRIEDLSAQIEVLIESVSKRLDREIVIAQFQSNDGMVIDPNESLLPQLDSGPLVIAVTITEDRIPQSQNREAHEC